MREGTRFCTACGTKLAAIDDEQTKPALVTDDAADAETKLAVAPLKVPVPELVKSQYEAPVVLQPKLYYGKLMETDWATIKKSLITLIISLLGTVVLAFILFDMNGYDSGPVARVTKNKNVNKSDLEKQLGEIIKTYCSVYYSGDSDAVARVAAPLYNNEKSYCTLIGNYFKGYEDGVYHYTEGVDDGDYIVVFSIDIIPIDMPGARVPWLGFLYVETDTHGQMHIKNQYSKFNLYFDKVKTDSWNESKYQAVAEFLNSENGQEIFRDVADKMEEALKDSTLRDFMNQFENEVLTNIGVDIDMGADRGGYL